MGPRETAEVRVALDARPAHSMMEHSTCTSCGKVISRNIFPGGQPWRHASSGAPLSYRPTVHEATRGGAADDHPHVWPKDLKAGSTVTCAVKGCLVAILVPKPVTLPPTSRFNKHEPLPEHRQAWEARRQKYQSRESSLTASRERGRIASTKRTAELKKRQEA